MKLKTVFSFIDAILILYLAYQFLRFWIYPQADEIEMIYDFAILMGFEFIMVHSGVFMSTLGKSWKMWLFFSLFYGLFALVFNTFISSNYVIVMYCTVVLNRMLSGVQVWNNKNTTKVEGIILRACMTSLIYFLLIIFVVCLCKDFIPMFGLSYDFLQTTDYDIEKMPGGILTENLHVSMCFGMLYYVALALMDIFSIVRTIRPCRIGKTELH